MRLRISQRVKQSFMLNILAGVSKQEILSVLKECRGAEDMCPLTIIRRKGHVFFSG